MESVLGRYRNLIILVGVLFLQVLGLAVQVKRGSNDAQDTRLIRIWAVTAITPLERGLVWIQRGTGNIWHNYFYLRGVRAENRQLKEQIEQMRLEQVRLNEDAAQAHRLQNLLAFKEQFVAKTVAAQVIGTSGSDFSRVIYIDRGEDYHIERDMAVMTADGIVGKVLEVYPSVAKILLINDQTSGVGVILGDSRLQGVLVGVANGEITLNGIMSDEEVTAGEKVLTSGGDQIFPKGLPVGVISKVGKGKDLFLSLKVKPAADLSKLEEVLVLVEKQERLATAEGKVRVRAADILAQRLPSVPDKPAADATGAAPQEPAKPAVTNPPAATTVPKTSGAAPQTAKTLNSGAAVSSMPAAPVQVKKTIPTNSGVATQKATDVSAAGTKPAVSRSTPSITEQKPAAPVAAPPNTQPPADDNTPH